MMSIGINFAPWIYISCVIGFAVWLCWAIDL